VPGRQFTLRVAAVVLRSGLVLLAHTGDDEYWYLPGGRITLGESSGDALRREIREELGVEVDPGPVRIVAENFFEAPDGKGGTVRAHELGIYREWHGGRPAGRARVPSIPLASGAISGNSASAIGPGVTVPG
jgi:8-oxo-dGTP pyrophosphatase MutT (NUDIX family)